MAKNKERRSLFSLIFKKPESENIDLKTYMQVLNGYQAVWTKYEGKIYDNVDVRACIDAISRNGAKFNPKHIRKGNKGYENIDSDIQRLVSEQPNELQNAYYFLYYVITELETYNDAFVYILRDENYKPTGLYPLHSGNYGIIEYNKKLYMRFNFGNGQHTTASMKDIIHLKRFCDKDGLVGGNNVPIIEALSFKHIVDEGLINAIKTTLSIKGVLKSTKAMLKPSDVQEMRNQFVKDFIENADGSGIGGLDATTDFKPIDLKPTTATDKQIETIDNKVLNYFGVNNSIVQSKYSEDEWNAFYESVLEPIAIQMSLEFTNKLFTIYERQHGNKIVFTSNRLQYASNNTKINIARYMNNYMTIDEIREIHNLPPLPDGQGQKVLQDLNHIDGSKATEYQIGEKEENEGDEKNE